MNRKHNLILFVALLALLISASLVTAQGPTPKGARAPSVNVGTAFTYQGQLKKNGVPVNGNCDLSFRLFGEYAVLVAGPVNGNPNPVSVTNGLFTVQIDFGPNMFTGAPRSLQPIVQCPGDSTPTYFARQELTPAPYASFSTAPWVTTGSNVYYNIGNVGIGVTNSNGVLNVNGTSWFQGDTTPLPSAAGRGIALGYPNGADFGYLFAFDYGTFAAKNLLLNHPGGNVGIGTANPTSRLTVRGPNTSGGTAAFLVENSNGLAGLKVFDDGSVKIGALWGNSGTHACLTMFLEFSACTSAAEYVPSIDSGDGFPETADVVSIASNIGNPYGDDHGPFVVTKSTQACDENLLGYIVNPELGADGKKLNDHYLPLAIYGYFPAKVTMANGAIRRGDPLTSSSKPGYAMKATSACKIIGYALEDANADGTIQVFAHLSENTATQVAVLQKENADLKAQNAQLETRVNTLEQQSASLQARMSTLEQLAQSDNPANTGNLALIVIGALLGIVVVQKPWRRGE